MHCTLSFNLPSQKFSVVGWAESDQPKATKGASVAKVDYSLLILAPILSKSFPRPILWLHFIRYQPSQWTCSTHTVAVSEFDAEILLPELTARKLIIPILVSQQLASPGQPLSLVMFCEKPSGNKYQNFDIWKLKSISGGSQVNSFGTKTTKKTASHPLHKVSRSHLDVNFQQFFHS